MVPLFDRVVTRIQTLETLSLGLSAFAVDVNQMSSALRAASASTLVLVDEFGKGTAEADGQVTHSFHRFVSFRALFIPFM